MFEVILIDHFDSFTSNLESLISPFSKSVEPVYSDINMSNLDKIIKSKQNPVLVLSPGYGSAYDHVNSINIVKKYQNIIPILGICLGHQIIAVANNGNVKKATPIHGKSSILITTDPFFSTLKNIVVGRYHSYLVTQIPSHFSVIAETDLNEIMAIKSKSELTIGLQFHVESILTTKGHDIIQNIFTHFEENHEFTKAS